MVSRANIFIFSIGAFLYDDDYESKIIGRENFSYAFMILFFCFFGFSTILVSA